MKCNLVGLCLCDTKTTPPPLWIVKGADLGKVGIKLQETLVDFTESSRIALKDSVGNALVYLTGSMQLGMFHKHKSLLQWCSYGL